MRFPDRPDESIALLAAAGLLAIVVFSLAGQAHTNQRAAISIGGSTVAADVASTPEQHARGLMFRTQLNETDGMLFVYGYDGYWTFWMKDTLIPLDIIWIDGNYSIIDIKESAMPCTGSPCASYAPSSAAKYVLEVNAGYVRRNNVTAGDRVSIAFGRNN